MISYENFSFVHSFVQAKPATNVNLSLIHARAALYWQELFFFLFCPTLKFCRWQQRQETFTFKFGLTEFRRVNQRYWHWSTKVSAVQVRIPVCYGVELSNFSDYSAKHSALAVTFYISGIHTYCLLLNSIPSVWELSCHSYHSYQWPVQFKTKATLSHSSLLYATVSCTSASANFRISVHSSKSHLHKLIAVFRPTYNHRL